MNYELLNNNKVYLQGTVSSLPEFNHSVMGEDFYSFDLDVSRLSGKDDILPVIISSKLLTHSLHLGEKFAMRGQFRSFNKVEDGKSKLILSVFCRERCEWDDNANSNIIELNGYICKSPIYRVTPFNREICDMLLAVNRNYDKSDYIPCIAWGRDAQYVGEMPVGTKVHLLGRIQSREYSKHIEGEDEPIQKVAYEVSVAKLSTLMS